VLHWIVVYARLLLQENHTSARLVQLSGFQRDAVCSMLSDASCNLDADIRAELSEVVNTIQWAAGDGDDVLAALRLRTPAYKRARRNNQSWAPALLQYLTESDWHTMLSDGDGVAKLEFLVNRTLSLGLRCPSEATLKLLNSLWILCCHSTEEIDRMGAAAKLSMLAVTKRTFDGFRRRRADPLDYVEQLPSVPLSFLRAHAELYEAHYNGGEPTAPKITSDVVVMFDMTYMCRARRSSDQQQTQVAMQQNAAFQMITTMLSQMQPSQQKQDTPIRIFENGHEHSRPHRRMPTMSFAELGAKSPPLLSLRASASSQPSQDESESGTGIAQMGSQSSGETPTRALVLAVPPHRPAAWQFEAQPSQ